MGISSRGKGQNVILLKLHAGLLRDLRLRGVAKTHSALVAEERFFQELFLLDYMETF